MAHYEQPHSDQGVRTEDGAQMDNGLHINQQPNTSTSENITAESLEIDSENEQPLNTSTTARKETKQAPIDFIHHNSTTFQTSVVKSISKVLPNKNIKMLHQYDQLRSDWKQKKLSSHKLKLFSRLSKSLKYALLKQHAVYSTPKNVHKIKIIRQIIKHEWKVEI